MADAITTLPAGEGMHRWPEALPGGRVLYTTASGSAFAAEAASIAVREADGLTRTLVRGAYYGRYAGSGHLVYMNNGTLFAAPFDPERAELTGQGVPVLEAVANTTNNGGTQVALSASGTAVYVPGRTVNNNTPISWLDASGRSEPLRTTPTNWSNPEFAPNGRQLAMDISDGTQADVWIYEWERDTLSRLTFDAADDLRPIWSPDGRRIAYASRRGGKTVLNLYWQRADGTGEVQRLTDSPNDQMTASFHPSGRFIAYDEVSPSTGRDIWILPLDGDDAAGWTPGKPTVFLQTPQLEGSPMFSPDGRWIAYISNETGRNEIYVRPFPGPGGKWQISTAPADDPTWSPTGGQLFFASTSDLRVMVSPFTVVGDSFRAEKPRVWSDGQFLGRPRPPSRDWAIHPDGRRFAIASQNAPQAQAKVNQMVFVFNFFDELRRVARPAR
jgi:serine/threonine-protein kinase